MTERENQNENQSKKKEPNYPKYDPRNAGLLWRSARGVFGVGFGTHACDSNVPKPDFALELGKAIRECDPDLEDPFVFSEEDFAKSKSDSQDSK